MTFLKYQDYARNPPGILVTPSQLVISTRKTRTLPGIHQESTRNPDNPLSTGYINQEDQDFTSRGRTKERAQEMLLMSLGPYVSSLEFHFTFLLLTIYLRY
jgi:hypothetical protein